MSASDPVVMFSDYACPWCYLGRARLQRALSLEADETQSAPRQALMLPFPLSPDTPPEGRDAVRYLSDKGIDLERALAMLLPLMEYPIIFDIRAKPRNVTSLANAGQHPNSTTFPSGTPDCRYSSPRWYPIANRICPRLAT